MYTVKFSKFRRILILGIVILHTSRKVTAADCMNVHRLPGINDQDYTKCGNRISDAMLDIHKSRLK